MDKPNWIKREAHQTNLDEDAAHSAGRKTSGPQETGPEIIRFSPANREDEEQHTPPEADADQNDKADDLLEGAIEELRRVVPRLEHSAKDREEALRIYLARAYKLSMAGSRDASRHEALLLRTKSKKRADTPHHKQTLRAIQKALGNTYVKGSEHEWSLVLAGMEEAKVPETEDAVIRYLTEPAEVGGQMVSGFDRPKAVLRTSETLKEKRKDRQQQKQIEREDTAAAVVRKVRDKPLGSIAAAEDCNVNNKIWISVNEGDKVLLELQLTDAELQKLVAKHKFEDEESEPVL